MGRGMIRYLIMLVIVTIPEVVFSQDIQSSGGGSEPSFIWIVIQAILALALVIAGIYLVVWVLKQAMDRSQGGGKSENTQLFGILYQSAISPKQSLYAIRFLDDLFIVAGNDEQVTVLHRYENFEGWEKLKDGTTQATGKFARLLQEKVMGVSGGSGTGT